MYLALARRYRPTRLQVTGRVYDPTPETPWTTTLRPFYGNLEITVEFNGECCSYFLHDTEDLEDPRVSCIADELYSRVRRRQGPRTAVVPFLVGHAK